MNASRSRARHCSVVGAAHRRQARPCQDASLSRELRGPGDEQLLLLAVADGHGGSRYRLSQVGSRLACEQASAAVEAALTEHDPGDLEQWRQLLAHELPAVIQRQWLAAVEADWRQRPEAAAEPFSPLTYGSTLGLALLTPGWWGCTGLGDWDLVRLDGSGSALVNEESEQAGPAEATASLCLPDAAGRWAERHQLEPLSPDTLPFTLLLSSDGVRKSCATDRDFLSLCGHLAELHQPDDLAKGLAQITAAGSGDDVSVAIGHWQPPDASPTPPASHKPAWVGSRTPRHQRRIGRALVIAAMLLLAGGAVTIALAHWRSLQVRETASRPMAMPNAATLASLARESQRLCRQPHLIPANLAQRKPQFRGLLNGDLQAPALIAAADRDPLGALIAASYQKASAPALGDSCVELRQALDQQWRLQGQASGRMPPASRPMATPTPTP